VEAGLRSFDRTMPEETNRILTDHMSDFLFCPSESAQKLLLREGIDQNKVFVTGNTIVDAVISNIPISNSKSTIKSKLKIADNNYILMTSHRKENVDNKEKFSNIIAAIKEINYTIIFPIHPRARKQAEKFGLLKNLPDHIILLEPIGYLDFLNLEKDAKLILTDSGGLQEEACILNTQCLTLRENTERPETVDVGANKVIGWKTDVIIENVNMALNQKKKKFKNPFGDGKASENILNIIGAI